MLFEPGSPAPSIASAITTDTVNASEESIYGEPRMKTFTPAEVKDVPGLFEASVDLIEENMKEFAPVDRGGKIEEMSTVSHVKMLFETQASRKHTHRPGLVYPALL